MLFLRGLGRFRVRRLHSSLCGGILRLLDSSKPGAAHQQFSSLIPLRRSIEHSMMSPLVSISYCPLDHPSVFSLCAVVGSASRDHRSLAAPAVEFLQSRRDSAPFVARRSEIFRMSVLWVWSVISNTSISFTRNLGAPVKNVLRSSRGLPASREFSSQR
jgi:hypothetical protein